MRQIWIIRFSDGTVGSCYGPREEAIELAGLRKDDYGESIYSNQKRNRMNLAANMLLQDKAKEIQEIAFCLGYENPGKFSSAFRSVMGLSPAEYRFRKETYDGK